MTNEEQEWEDEWARRLAEARMLEQYLAHELDALRRADRIRRIRARLAGVIDEDEYVVLGEELALRRCLHKR